MLLGHKAAQSAKADLDRCLAAMGRWENLLSTLSIRRCRTSAAIWLRRPAPQRLRLPISTTTDELRSLGPRQGTCFVVHRRDGFLIAEPGRGVEWSKSLLKGRQKIPRGQMQPQIRVKFLSLGARSTKIGYCGAPTHSWSCGQNWLN
jgi:hypothetical protein